jgi:mycothiol synthase
MPIRMRAYAGGNEQQRMAQLVQTFPAGNLHVVDLPYRLSSWAFDFPENVGLWEDEREQLLAWAVLQTPFWSLDYALHPGAYEQDVLAEILTWTKTRAQQIRDQPNNGRPMWFVHVPADQGSQMRLLEDAGFYSVEHHAEHPWSGLYLTRTGQAPVPDFSVPDGWTIRPLAGEREVAAYVALHRTVFGSTSMTVDWRARVLQRLNTYLH